VKGLGVRTALVVIGCVTIVGSLIVGIDDNLPGIAILYGGITCLVLSAVCRWQQPKSFAVLFALSALGFIVFAVLHNVFYGIGEMATISWAKALLEGLHVAAFLIALLVCPVGVLVGLVGWSAALIRSRGVTGHGGETTSG
jgi:hypothetical protein